MPSGQANFFTHDQTPNALLVLAPAVMLAIIVLAFSFLGDGLRQAFNPGER